MTDFHHRGKFLQIVSLLLVSYFMLLFQSIAQERDRPNVLFIAVDDLRPELGAYGKAYAITPHMDRLASQSSLFTNHYVTVPTCGASRYSLLVGKLPQSRQDLSNMAAVNQLARKPESERRKTFIQDFRQKGYYTVGIGKISHHPDGYVYEYDERKSDLIELPGSWDEMLFNPGKWETGHNAFFGYADGSNRTDRNKQVKPYEMAEVSDEGYVDGLSAELAIAKLQELKAKDQPFFLGLGFFKPHLPFTAPKKYWDLYDPEEIPLAPFPAIPQGSSRASLIQSGEFNQYALGEEKAGLDQAVSDPYAHKLRHAYLAAVSYVDAQIGKVLDELERLGLDENTVIVLWGDHGWHLGDQLVWGKHTLFESALHSVLMIKAPGIPSTRIKQVVSTLDIYPTLLDLTGNADDSDLDGKSLVGLMKNSQSENWRNTAYSYFNQGISLRTPTHRLTQYFRSESSEFELYDLIQDPNETQNIASYSPQVFGVLKALLDAGNTGLFDKQ
ncbi:sulfatase [Algoriphagus formosus]|uniref:sulfatase n=1 Tax=Algoriphagus formosus TaxID=2007308 RepID=UPI001E2D43F8|nr:sulfatase [Algoriphagus formosus]